MKILALVTDAFGAGGGIAQYNRDLMCALAKQPSISSITVLTRTGNSEDIPEKIHQCRAVSNKLSYALNALRQVFQNKPDVIFCGHINFMPLAWVISKFTAKPVWLQLHGIDAWKQPSRLIGRLVKNVAMVTCVSRYTRRRFLSWAIIDGWRVKILPNTVGNSNFSEPVLAINSLPDLTGKKAILTVGRLSASERYKGHDRIIVCMPELLKQDPDVLYLIAGDGDDRERLKLLAEKHGVATNVIFLGKVPNEQLVALYSAVDLFAMPSTGEGFGIVFLEAMAAGTPALGLDSDGSTDPLQDGRLGTVTSEEQLCVSLAEALKANPSPDLRQRVQEVFGRNNFEQHVQRLLNVDPLKEAS